MRLLLRYAPEMNGRWEPWHRDPAGYVRAWRHIYRIFQQEGAPNVKFVWTPALPAATTSFADWRQRVRAYWPGARYVDYVGTTTISHHHQPVSYFAARLPQLASFHKPLVLAEVYAPVELRPVWLPALARMVNGLPSVHVVVWCDLSGRSPLAGPDAAAFSSIDN